MNIKKWVDNQKLGEQPTNGNNLGYSGAIQFWWICTNQPRNAWHPKLAMICVCLNHLDTTKIAFLVGGLEHEFYFSIQLGINNPNWLIFLEGMKPPTRFVLPWQIWWWTTFGDNLYFPMWKRNRTWPLERLFEGGWNLKPTKQIIPEVN